MVFCHVRYKVLYITHACENAGNFQRGCVEFDVHRRLLQIDQAIILCCTCNGGVQFNKVSISFSSSVLSSSN